MKRLGFDLIILGAPASGKDTQAQILMEQYHLTPIQTGKQWRSMVKKNDKRGKWLQRTFGKGFPAPVAIVKWFLNSKINSVQKTKDLIFIGNPRLKPEAQFVFKKLNQKARDFIVLYITLTDKEIISRSLKRKVQEDTIANTTRRMTWHKSQVSKTINYFKSKGKLRVINGNQPIVKVTKDISKAINDYQRSRTN